MNDATNVLLFKPREDERQKLLEDICVGDAVNGHVVCSKLLVKAWHQYADPARAAHVDALINAGAELELRIVGGLHGKPWRVLGYLITAAGDERAAVCIFDVPENPDTDNRLKPLN